MKKLLFLILILSFQNNAIANEYKVTYDLFDWDSMFDDGGAGETGGAPTFETNAINDPVFPDNSYQYIMNNYDSSKNYTVSADTGSASLTDNTLNLSTPTTVPSDNTITLTFDIDGDQYTRDIDFYEETTPEVNIAEGTTVDTDSNNTYTITNYDSNIDYTASADSGNASVSNDTITYTAPSTVPSSGQDTLTVGGSGNESTYTFDITDSTDGGGDTTYEANIDATNGDEVETDSTSTYTITNYDDTVNYSVSSTDGSASVSGDTITLQAPSTIPSSGNLDLTVTADGVDTTTTFNVVEPYQAQLDTNSNETVVAGEEATYTISNYDDTVSYTVSASSGGASITGNTITYTAPSTTPSSGEDTLTVTADGVDTTQTININEPYVPQLSTSSGDTVVAGDSATYTIDNYDSTIGHTVSAVSGTASISGDTITYTAPSTVPTSGDDTLTVSVNGNDTTRTIIINEPYSAELSATEGAEVYTNEDKTVSITNYDSNVNYTVSANSGNATISGDTITYTAPSTVPSSGNDTLTVSADGVETTTSFTITDPYRAELGVSDGAEIKTARRYAYEITNYDSSVNYTVSVTNNGSGIAAGVVIGTDGSGNDIYGITIEAPDFVPDGAGTIDVVVGADGVESTTTLNVVYEPSITMIEAAPGDTTYTVQDVQDADGTLRPETDYIFEILNYDTEKDYTVTANPGTATISGNEITLSTPSSETNISELELLINW